MSYFYRTVKTIVTVVLTAAVYSETYYGKTEPTGATAMSLLLLL